MKNLNLFIHIVYEHYLNMLSILIKNAFIFGDYNGGCRPSVISEGIVFNNFRETSINCFELKSN